MTGTCATEQSGFYPGWRNVLGSFTGLALSYAMFTVFAFGTFVAPLEAEFGWSRAQISFALTVTNLTIVFCSPALGFLVDRLGVRRVLIPSIVLMAAAVAAMSLLQGKLWQLYALYLLIPLLGAGTLPLSYSRIIIAWFDRRRGIALGIALAGFGVGATLVPALAQQMIAAGGWRSAYLGFALLIVLINLPLSWLLLHDSPRAENRDASARARADGPGGAEAWRSRSYWLILVSFALAGIGITGVLAHLVPMLIARGVAPATASLCMSLLGVGLIVGRVLSGLMMDRFFAPRVAALFLLGLGAGIALLAAGVSGPLALLAAVLAGLATGAEISEIAYIVSRYFGQRAFGRIYGIMFAAFQLGSAIAAPALGIYYDHHGDYSGALWLIAVLVLIAAALIASLGKYPDLAQPDSRPA